MLLVEFPPFARNIIWSLAEQRWNVKYKIQHIYGDKFNKS